MSELTTPVAIEILIDEMCDRITNYQHEACECPGEYAVRKWLAQVQCEAKIEVLREAAEHINKMRDASTISIGQITDEQFALAREHMQFKESPTDWLLDRADRMEEEK